MDAFGRPFCSTTQLRGRSRGIFVRILSVVRPLYLSLLPLEEFGFSLHKGAFRDAIALRYGWLPQHTPTTCTCGTNFSVEHALSCHPAPREDSPPSGTMRLGTSPPTSSRKSATMCPSSQRYSPHWGGTLWYLCHH